MPVKSASICPLFDQTGTSPVRASNGSRSHSLPAGDYALRCYVDDDGEADEQSGKFNSISEVEAAVLTPDERAYYHKVNYAELALIGIGWLLFLAFLPLARRWGWKIALPVTLIVALPYFHWLDGRSKRRAKVDVRWQAINQKLSAAWLGDAPRTFVLELRRVQSRDGLKGGSVTI